MSADRKLRELLQRAVDDALAELQPGEELRGFLLHSLIADLGTGKQYLRNYGVGHCQACGLVVAALDRGAREAAGILDARDGGVTH